MTKALVSKNCADCNAPLQRINGRFKKRCITCQDKFETTKRTTYENKRKLNRKPILLEISCATCGNKFIKQKLGTVSRYCDDCKQFQKDSSGRLKPPKHVIERGRRHHFQKNYGLSIEQRDAILKLQSGKCAICQDSETENNYLQIDHDHNCCPTAKTCGNCVRGLICSRCNRALGMLDDNPYLARDLVIYLKKYPRSGNT